MKKRDYFIASLEKKLYLDKRWLLRVLGVPMKQSAHRELPHLNEAENALVVVDGENVIPFEDYDPTSKQPLYSRNEKVKLPAGTIGNLNEELTTTYQIAILNAILLADTLGDKIPYRNDRFTPKWLDGVLEDGLRSKEITVDEFKRVMKAVGFISFVSEINVPTTTIELLRSSPEVKKLRDELVAKYADQLDDPVVVAEIDAAIVAKLKEELKGSPAEGFYVKGKQIDKVRKMTHGMIGGFTKLDDPGKVNTITRSLDEGWTAADIPALVNQLRAGSYDRGKETQVGGEFFNFSTRLFQNLKIVETDCGTKVGLPVVIDKDIKDEFVSRYIVGRKTPLTAEDLKGLVGKEIILRDPATCISKNGNYCEVCLGDTVAKSKIGLGPQLNGVSNALLSISLASFHGKELKTEKYDPLDAIS